MKKLKAEVSIFIEQDRYRIKMKGEGEHFHLRNIKDSIEMKMRGIGFEPMKALDQQILSLSRLTASLPSHEKPKK